MYFELSMNIEIRFSFLSIYNYCPSTLNFKNHHVEGFFSYAQSLIQHLLNYIDSESGYVEKTRLS